MRCHRFRRLLVVVEYASEEGRVSSNLLIGGLHQPQLRALGLDRHNDIEDTLVVVAREPLNRKVQLKNLTRLYIDLIDPTQNSDTISLPLDS
jgi:hypothetical protein